MAKTVKMKFASDRDYELFKSNFILNEEGDDLFVVTETKAGAVMEFRALTDKEYEESSQGW